MKALLKGIMHILVENIFIYSILCKCVYISQHFFFVLFYFESSISNSAQFSVDTLNPPQPNE